jgi:hypothetical protein
MKKILAWPLCVALYWVGHWASKLCYWLDSDEEQPGWPFDTAWWVYQRAMAQSLAWNDWGGLDQWERDDSSASDV